MNPTSLVALSLLAAVLSIRTSAEAQSNERRWGFASQAVSPCSDGGPSQITYPAPDGTKAVRVEVVDGNSSMYVAVAGARHAVEYAAWPCPELQWSSDSLAFFVNYSNGGAVGDYEVRVFYPSRASVRAVDPTTLVRQDSRATYPKCFLPESPNLAGIAWLDGSRRLLVAAEVLPHSNCDSMGTFSAYEVEVPSGKVVRKWGCPVIDNLRLRSRLSRGRRGALA
jgi:hypothetical protein